MKPTPSQMKRLRHALGLNEDGSGEPYRNRYNAPPTADSHADCLALVYGGLMEQHGLDNFSVTRDGERWARSGW